MATKNDLITIFSEGKAGILPVDPYEVKLLQLIFAGVYEKEAINDLISDLNLDNASSSFLLILAHYGRTHKWEYFPHSVAARAEGIQRFYQVKNTTLMPGLVEYVHALADEKIDVLFGKGIAMRAYYDPGVSRIMHDADLMVRPQDYDRALQLAKKLGFSIATDSLHSVDLRRDMAAIDLHRFFLRNGEGNDDTAWVNAISVDWNQMHVYVPSPEYQMLIQLYNEFDNILGEEASTARLKWLYDAAVLSSRVNWEKVKVLSEQYQIQEIVLVMLRTLNYYLPDCVPSLIISELQNCAEKGGSIKHNKIIDAETYAIRRKSYKDKDILRYYAMWIPVKFKRYRAFKAVNSEKASGGFILFVIKVLKEKYNLRKRRVK